MIVKIAVAVEEAKEVMPILVDEIKNNSEWHKDLGRGEESKKGLSVHIQNY
jgi:hypothetical protein